MTLSILPFDSAALVAARGDKYGDPVDGMRRIAARWSITLGIKVTPMQVCQCMIDLKQARLDLTPDYSDGPADIAGYAEIMRILQAEKTA